MQLLLNNRNWKGFMVHTLSFYNIISYILVQMLLFIIVNIYKQNKAVNRQKNSNNLPPKSTKLFNYNFYLCFAFLSIELPTNATPTLPSINIGLIMLLYGTLKYHTPIKMSNKIRIDTVLNQKLFFILLSPFLLKQLMIPNRLFINKNIGLYVHYNKNEKRP